MTYSIGNARRSMCALLTVIIATFLCLAGDASSQQQSKFPAAASDQPSDGEVFLFINTNSGRCLGVKDGKIVQGPFPETATAMENWKAVRVGDHFKLVNQKSGRVLAVPFGAKKQGTKLVEVKDAGAINQQWEFAKVGDHFSIKSRMSGLVVAVGKGIKNENANAFQWTMASIPDQIWQVKTIDRKVEVAQGQKEKLKQPNPDPTGQTLTFREGVANTKSEISASDLFEPPGRAVGASGRGGRLKSYKIELQEGKTYQIDMTSEVIDPFLRLHNPAGKLVAEDDDSGGKLNARIIYKCKESGTYKVTTLALRSLPTIVGPFELTAKELSSKVDAAQDKKEKPKQATPESTRTANDLLFPLHGVTLGKTTVDELKKLGKRPDKTIQPDWNLFFVVNDLRVWHHDTNVAHMIGLGTSDKMPQPWQKLGFDFKLSYDAWLKLFAKLGWDVKVLEEPKAVKHNFKEHNSLRAEIEVTSGDIRLLLQFRNGQGSTTADSYTLDYLLVTTKVLPPKVARLDYVKTIAPDVVNNIARQAFLKKYPKAKLLNFEPRMGIREYDVNGAIVQFAGEKIIGRRSLNTNGTLVGSKDLSRKLLDIMEEKLGKPDDTSINDDDKKRRMVMRLSWDLAEKDFRIIGSIVEPDDGGAPALMTEVLHLKNIRSFEKE